MLTLLKKIFFCSFLFMVCSGCSATSSAERFGNKKDRIERSKEKGRFQTEPKEENKLRPIQNKDIKVLPDTTEEEFDEIPPKENAFDKKKFIADYRNYINPDIPISFREKILLEVIKFLETPYKYGGNTEEGIDCSGFTKEVFKSAFNYELPRSAREQYTVGESVEQEDLDFGDLVFFNTRRRSNPGHVGIYIGDNQFIHASRTLGVTISSLDESYYLKRYVGARRVEGIDSSVN